MGAVGFSGSLGGGHVSDKVVRLDGSGSFQRFTPGKYLIPIILRGLTEMIKQWYFDYGKIQKRYEMEIQCPLLLFLVIVAAGCTTAEAEQGLKNPIFRAFHGREYTLLP